MPSLNAIATTLAVWSTWHSSTLWRTSNKMRWPLSFWKARWNQTIALIIQSLPICYVLALSWMNLMRTPSKSNNYIFILMLSHLYIPPEGSWWYYPGRWQRLGASLLYEDGDFDPEAIDKGVFKGYFLVRVSPIYSMFDISSLLPARYGAISSQHLHRISRRHLALHQAKNAMSRFTVWHE